MAESMQGLHRSHRCTEVSNKNIGETVTVMGWVQKKRNLGSLIFVDLRDRSGLLQLVFDDNDKEVFEKAGKLRNEFVIAAVGTVNKRAGSVNESMETGDIENVRDIDLVISTKKVGQFHEICAKYHTKKNSFGGYKINCDDFTIDLWRIESTWAYKKNIIKCSEEDYLKNLPYTVFYNMDSLVYDIKNNIWYDDLYKETKESNVLDIVLEENPHVDLNILRGMIFQNRYHMKYSERLKKLICERCKNEKEYEKILYSIELKRYKKEILSLKDIEEQLYYILSENVDE